MPEINNDFTMLQLLLLSSMSINSMPKQKPAKIVRLQFNPICNFTNNSNWIQGKKQSKKNKKQKTKNKMQKSKIKKQKKCLCLMDI